jgi:hypothetical protein
MVSASAAYTIDRDKNYVFTVGRLSANECRSIIITDSVKCGNEIIRDLTQCTKVWITPSNVSTTSLLWDKSNITLKSQCIDNGRVRLSIYNTGTGNMADSSSFRIFQDANLILNIFLNWPKAIV